MKILALETSMQACSVAILDIESGNLFSDFERMERGHAECLISMMQNVLKKAGCPFSDLDYLAVTQGPGSFTGVRVGLSTARALSLALQKPLHGFSSLHVLARQTKAMNDTHHEHIAVVVDARRDQLYVQLFTSEADPVSEPLLLSAGEMARFLPQGSCLCVGNGASFLEKEMSGREGDLFVLPDLLPNAESLARLCGDRIGSDQGLVVPKVSPLYLRPADAKPQTGKSIARI